MSFKEFDLSDYINALADFKSNQAETAIQQFSSIEKYTEEMKHCRRTHIQRTDHCTKAAGGITPEMPILSAFPGFCPLFPSHPNPSPYPIQIKHHKIFSFTFSVPFPASKKPVFSLLCSLKFS